MNDTEHIINSSIISSLSFTANQINRYVPMFLFLIGSAGNIFGCVIWIHPKLRINQCIWYFFAANCSSMLYLIAAISPLLSAWNSSLDLANTVPIICKIRMLIILVTRTLSLWFIAFAAIDRYLFSRFDNNEQRLRFYRNPIASIGFFTIFSFLLWLETIFCFKIQLVAEPISCYPVSTTCRIYNDIVFPVVSVIIPCTLMLIFGLLSIKNILRSRRMLNPLPVPSTATENADRKLQRNLTKILIIQVTLMVTFNLPHALYTLYLTITSYNRKEAEQRDLETFIYKMLLLVTFTSNSISFYFNLLTGSTFRRTAVELIQTQMRYVNRFFRLHR